MKKFIFLIALLLSPNALAHSGVGNYDSAFSVCVSNPGTAACDYITAHNAAHAADAAAANSALSFSANAGGFDIVYGGDNLLTVTDAGLFRALGSIFLVMLSLIALFIGYQKLRALWLELEGDPNRGRMDSEDYKDYHNGIPVGEEMNITANDFDDNGNFRGYDGYDENDFASFAEDHVDGGAFGDDRR